MNSKYKLRTQIVSVVIAFYIIGMTVFIISMYRSSRTTFLSAKNDMIERDVSRICSTLNRDEGYEWYFEYVSKHCNELKSKISSIKGIEERIIPESRTYEELNSLSPELQLNAAIDYYFKLKAELDYEQTTFNYGGLFCIDISSDDNAFVYYSAVKNSTSEISLGKQWDTASDSHPALDKLRSGDYTTIAFEISSSDWDNSGANYYVGYKPLVYNDSTKAVIGIDYNWDSFHDQLMDQLRTTISSMLLGMIVSCILLMVIMERIAIQPLSKVQHTVKEYIKDKNAESAKELCKLKSQNEIGELSEDISALINEVSHYTSNLKNFTKEIMEALAHTIDAKDRYTDGHSFRVAAYSRMLAKRLGLSQQEQEDIYYMGLLHDIGKIGIPGAIINKPSKLTDEEYEIIKKHPIYGYEILSPIKSMPELAIGARHHHERIDGKGYPDGLKGDEIPFKARIIAVADSYDTMTSNRNYRKYLPQELVRKEIEKNIGTQFDPAPANAMLKIIDEDKNYLLHE